MKKTFYKQKGFTLIELLVVIAIIGLLSSVVLAALSSARAKGGDTAVKTNLANIRAQAELLQLNLGCYTDTGTCSTTVPAVFATAACPTSGTGNIFRNAVIAQQIAAATTASGNYNSCSATVGGSAWAVAVVLKQDQTKAWCVDSTGASKQIAHTAAYTQATLNADILTGAVCGS